MLKFLKQTIKLIVLLVILVYGAQLVANQWVFNKYLPKLKSKIEKNYNVQLISGDNIVFKVLPFPHISIEKVSVYDEKKELILKSEEISFNLDLEKLIKRQISLESVIFKNAQFYVNDMDSQPLMGMDIVINLYKNFLRKNNFFNLKNVEIHDSSLTYLRDLEKYQINNFNLLVNLPSIFSKKIIVKSKFLIDGSNYIIGVQARDIDDKNIPHNIVLNIGNDIISLKMNGNLKGFKDTPWYKGNLQLNVNTNRARNSALFKHIAKKDTINTMNANLEYKDDVFTIDEFSSNLKRTDDIIGKIILDVSAVPRVNCDLSIKKLDIDLLLSGLKNKEKILSSEQFFRFLLKNRDFSIPANVSSSVSVKIDEIKFFSDFVRNFNLSMDMFTRKAFLNDLSFEMPGNSTMVLNGIVTTNKIRPKFKGSVVFGSKEVDKLVKWFGINFIPMNNYNNEILVLKSDILLLPHILELNHFQSALDRLRVVGKIIVSESSSQKINTYATMDVNEFNATSIGTHKFLNDIINVLYISDGDKTGETFVNLTRDFKFLRGLRSSYNLDLNVHKLNLYNQIIDDFYIALAAKQDRLKLVHVEGYNQSNRFSGNGSFSVEGFKPFVAANLEFNTIDLPYLLSILPSKAELQKNLLLYNKSELRNQKKAQAQNKTYSKLNFFSSAFIDGKINIKTDNLIFKDNVIHNLDLEADSNNGIISFDSVKFKAYGGDLNLTGNISTMEPICHANFGVGAYNLDPNPFFEHYFYMKDKIKGYVSFSSIINTSGTNFNALQDNMKGHVKVIGKNITWNGFGLDKIIKAAESNSSYQENLKILDYYSKYGSSFFNSIQGEIEVSNGIAAIPNLSISTNRATGSYAANYNIDNKLIKSIAKFSFIPIGQKSPLDFSFSSSGKIPNLKTEFEDKKIIDHLKSMIPQVSVQNHDKEPQKPDYLRDMTSNIIN